MALRIFSGNLCNQGWVIDVILRKRLQYSQAKSDSGNAKTHPIVPGSTPRFSFGLLARVRPALTYSHAATTENNRKD